MTAITFANTSAARSLDMLQTVRNSGLVQGQDFDWAWHPRQWDSMTGDTPGFVEFRFQDPALATFFQLMWNE